MQYLLLLLDLIISLGVGFLFGYLLRHKLTENMFFALRIIILIICMFVYAYTDWGKQIYVMPLGISLVVGMDMGSRRK